MTTAEKYSLLINEKIPAVHEAGKAQSGPGIFYYATRMNNAFGGVVFPENTEFVARFKGAIDYSYMFNNCRNLKSVKIITETPDTVLNMAAFTSIGDDTASTLELVDFSEFNKQFNYTVNLFAYQSKLKTVLGAMDLTSCTNCTNMFRENRALEDVEFVEGTIPISISFANCSLLTAKSLNSIMNGLSSEVTGQTLTLPKYNTVKATYDSVYGDGAWDAIVATKSNWTIAYS